MYKLYITKVSKDGKIEECVGGTLILPPEGYLYLFEVGQDVYRNLSDYKIVEGKLIKNPEGVSTEMKGYE